MNANKIIKLGSVKWNAKAGKVPNSYEVQWGTRVRPPYALYSLYYLKIQLGPNTQYSYIISI